MPSRLLLAIAALALLGPAARLAGPELSPGVPRVVLWAWERPIDLRTLPRGAGVAVLAQTITLSSQAHLVAHRRQPLRVNTGTPVVAVTRIEAPGEASPADTAAIARAIAATATLPGVAAIQIDFDARASQRAMYRRLLHDVRAAMPPHLPLSMTALASWCLDDNWLDELPVDEAVPMLFRMGPAEAVLRREWPSRRPAAKCRASIGVSLDEPRPFGRRAQRVYIFNPGPWTESSVGAALEVGKW